MVQFNVHFDRKPATVAVEHAQILTGETVDQQQSAESAQIQELGSNLSRMVQGIRTELQQSRQKRSLESVDFAVEICRHLLQTDDESSLQRIRSFAETAMDQIGGEDRFAIYVSPEDVSRLQTLLADSNPDIEIMDDPSLQSGDCRVEQGSSGLASNLESQLGVLRQKLMQSVSSSKGGM